MKACEFTRFNNGLPFINIKEQYICSSLSLLSMPLLLAHQHPHHDWSGPLEITVTPAYNMHMAGQHAHGLSTWSIIVWGPHHWSQSATYAFIQPKLSNYNLRAVRISLLSFWCNGVVHWLILRCRCINKLAHICVAIPSPGDMAWYVPVRTDRTWLKLLSACCRSGEWQVGVLGKMMAGEALGVTDYVLCCMHENCGDSVSVLRWK